MKNVKINLAVFAAVLGIGFAVANSPAAKATGRTSNSWFAYNGSGSVTDPSNYTEVSGTPDCPGTTAMCSIEAAVGSGDKPVITNSLKTEINTAIADQAPSADVLLHD